jgi:hypothetical protein
MNLLSKLSIDFSIGAAANSLLKDECLSEDFDLAAVI